MLQWQMVQSFLGAVCVLVSVAAASEAGVRDPFTKDGQERQKEVSPWVLPHWWWLSSVLSLPGQDHTTHTATKTNPDRMNSPEEEEEDSTMSLVLPLDGEGESERDKSEVSRVGGSSVARVDKRSQPCRSQGKGRCRRGLVSTVQAAQVHHSWKNEYSSVPEALVRFSQEQAEETACKDLSVQLFRVDLSEHYLEPLWVRDTAHLGMCPSKLQTRYLGKNVFPSSVVETRCMCQQQPCSSEGGEFRCQAVQRPIRTWVRHEDQFMPTKEMVSVGCVCVQQTSPEGQFARPDVFS